MISIWIYKKNIISIKMTIWLFMKTLSVWNKGYFNGEIVFCCFDIFLKQTYMVYIHSLSVTYWFHIHFIIICSYQKVTIVCLGRKRVYCNNKNKRKFRSDKNKRKYFWNLRVQVLAKLNKITKKKMVVILFKDWLPKN